MAKKNKGGRPTENGVKMKCYSTSLTPMERRRLGALARSAGLTFSAWSRRVLIANLSANPPIWIKPE